MSVYLWLLIAIIASTVYLLLFRQFTIDQKVFILILIVVFGIVSLYADYQVYSKGSLGAMNGIITGSVIVLTFLGSIALFNERITLVQIVALSLIVAGVAILAVVG